MSRQRRDLLLLLFSASLAGAACDEKKPSTETPQPDAGAEANKYLAADPKLTKAFQAVTHGGGPTDDGPPTDGVFPPGGADRRHPSGAPAKVELMSEGTEPRMALGPEGDAATEATRTSSYGPAALEIAMQMGPRSALPTIDLSLVVGPSKSDAAGPDGVLVSVKKALPSRDQADEVGPDGARAIGSLEGTQIFLKLTADGRESDVRTALGKGARPELDRVAKNAAEALVLATVPVPPKPVGAGAQWIAETRMPWSGVDVIAYRAFRVKSVEGERLTLAVNVKAYAASGDIQLQGVPPGATLKQFEAEAQGEMQTVRGELFARKLEMQERVVFVFSSPTPTEGQPPTDQPARPEGSTLTAQIQAAATFVRGDDLRAGAERGRTGHADPK